MKIRELKIGVVHLYGAILFAALALLMTVGFTGDAWRMAFDEQLGGETAWAFARQAGVAASFWLILAAGWSSTSKLRRELSGSRATHRIISTRGTAMVETIIALPVVFLFSFGLVQFALNNVAAVMVNYATFTASRAAWIWEPEGDLDEAAERGRVAAAVALTPVAYGGGTAPAEAESQTLSEARGMMVAAQFPTIDVGMSKQGVLEGRSLAANSSYESPSMAMIFGQDSFKGRSARQMTAAYRSIIVEVVEQGDELETTLRYQHFIAMPLVSRVFGEYGVVQGKVGYWMLFERSYTRARMGESNRNIDSLVGADNTPSLL